MTDWDKAAGAAIDDDGLRVRAATLVAKDRNPDAYAKASQIAQRNGWETDVVANDPAPFEQHEEAERIASAAQANPAMAPWLSDPANVTIAKDDVGVLERIGSAFRGNYFWQRAEVGAMSSVGGTQQALGDHVGSAMRAGVNPLATLYEIAERQARQSGDEQGAQRARAGADVFRRENAGEAFASRGKQIAQFAAEDRATVTAGVNRPGSVLDAVTSPWNATKYYGGMLAESAPGILTAMATRNPNAAAGVAGLSTGGSTYAEERAAGKNVMQSTLAGVEQGFIEGGLSKPVFDIAMGGGSRRVLRSMVAESGSEGLTQLMQTNVSDAHDGVQTPIAEQLLQTLDAMLVGAPSGAVEGMLGARGARKLGQTVQDGAAAQAERVALDGLVTDALQSKTRERSPEQFDALVQAQAPDAMVYIPVDALTTLYQSERDASAAMHDLTGSETAWDEAIATGGEVAIPLSKYVTHLAEQHAGLAGQVRMVPGQDVRPDTPMPTPEEIQTDIAAALAEARESDARENGPAGQVFDDVYGQLLTRVDEVTARNQAAVAQSFYRTMAERTGTDAWSLFERFRINIDGATTQGPQRRGIDTDIDPILDALRSNNLPSDKEIYGESLVSALVKAGGVTDHGGDLRSQDALLQRPGLVSLAGMSLDDAVTWAHQEGFINAPTNGKDGGFDADAPDINSLLDLLTNELGGAPAYRQNAQNGARLKFRDDANALSEELRTAGIDLSVADNATVRAKLGVTLEQPAYHGSPHHFTKFSLQAMGTGEGAQAYGWGLYFASNKDIAEQYRVTLAEQNASAETKGFTFGGQDYARDTAEGHALNLLKNGGKREAIATAKEMVADAKAGKPYTQERGRDPAHYDRLLVFVLGFDAKKTGQIKTLRDKGQLYQVDVPDDSDLLDWDKPLSEQPEKVRAALAESDLNVSDDDTGNRIYRTAAARGFGDTAERHKAASEYLNSLGIPGLRFLDGNSRNKGKGSHNYVIWDEAAISEPTTFYQSSIPEASEIEQLRARVAALEAELRTDNLTGLRNQRAFEEDEALGWSTVAAADMDGLKKLNDAIGHEAADSVLKHLGAVLLATETEGVRFYRRSGDEFAARFENEADATQIMADLQARLEQVAISMEVADAAGAARSLTYAGIGISYGTGQDYAAADAGANANKRERLAAGIREEARSDGEPRRLRPRAPAWGESDRRADSRPAGSADQVTDQTPPTGGVSASGDPTQTPAFAKWFGDSKVVDADGKPLVVYHGTAAEFDAFDDKKTGTNDLGLWGRGHYFASNPETASSYALRQGDGARVIPAYVSIKSPLVLRTGSDLVTRLPDGANTRDLIGPNLDGAKIKAVALEGGHDGVIQIKPDGSIGDVVTFRPEQIKSATANSGNFDGSDPSILNQPGDGSPRGSITFGKDDQGRRVFNIRLLEGADLSTFLHEGGHAFLEMLGDLAQDANAPAQVQADYAKVLAWLGVESRDAIQTEHHEQWARGFEAYYRDGKAPSGALRRSFARFKVWLTALYKAAGQLNVTLNDDVRGVFDRLLATDAEIAEAHTAVYHEALITDALAVGMSPAQHDAYTRAVETAKADAEATLAAEVLREQQRAQRAFQGAERKVVLAEVTAATRELPVYRALRWLRNGLLPDGSPVPEAIKLSKEALLDDYGQSFLRHLRGTYSVEGGVSPDQAAALLGFGSGSQLVTELVNAPKFADVVKADTDRIMAERYPDPLTDGSLPDRAMAAVHSKRQADVMLREVQALEQHTTGAVRTQAHILREVARQLVADKRVRDVQPNTYRQAEAKAGKTAFEAAAKQDWPTALAARRRQLLNHLLHIEATKARSEASKAGKFLLGYTKTKKRAALGKAGHDYLEQIDGLLERFDLRAMSGKASDRRSRLAAWIAAKRADGVAVDLPEKLLDEAFRKPWRDLSVSEVRQLRDAVKHLAHLANLKNSLLLKGERIDREAVDAEMAASLLSARDARPDRTGDPTLKDQTREWILKARGLTAAATDIARELDGFADVGGTWNHTVRVIRDANQVTNAELRKAQESMAGLYRQHYSVKELRDLAKRTYIAEVGDSWSKGRLLSLALNWGNAGNREAILAQTRGKLAPEQVGVLLGKLDARDWAFVQGVWDRIDSHWPAIAEAQRKRTGLVPGKVEAAPFAITTSDGQQLAIRGGYYPLKYEADSTKGMREEADDFFEAVRTGQFSKASTKDGHTVERVGSGGRRVNLELSVLDTHLRDVIRDVHLGDAVNYVYLAMRGQQFNAAANDTGMTEHVKALEIWLKDVASGEIGPRIVGESVLRAIRTNFTAAVLTYKVSSALLQVTGIVQTSVVLGKAATLNGVKRYLRRPIASTRYVTESSTFMDGRMRSHIEAVQEVMNAKASRFESGRQAMIRHGYWMIGRMQQIVDVSTWMGAEERGLELFPGDIKKARAYADDVVSRAQGSGEFIDKSPLQRGTLGDKVKQTEYVRATTALMGYMIAKSNAAYARTRVTNFRSPKQGIKWAADMVNLFMVEALITAVIKGKLPDDEDDDGLLDDLGLFALQEGAANVFGGIPGLSQGVTELRGYDAKGVIANAWGSVADFIEQVKQGDLDKAAVKKTVSLAGFATGLPSSQINTTIDAIAAEQDGADISPYAYLVGPPKP